MTPLTLQELQQSVKLPDGEVGQLLKAGFDMWPLPASDTPMGEHVVAAIWLMDALHLLGVLNAAGRAAAIPTVGALVSICGEPFKEFIETVQSDYSPTSTLCVRLADRRYLAILSSSFLDLQTGQTVHKLPQAPIERLIYDIGVIWAQRRGVPHGRQPHKEVPHGSQPRSS